MRMKFTTMLATLLVCLGIPALAASTSYYAKTTVYFNVPTDASFSIALPNDYTSWTTITGTTEGGATATDWISFNFTAVPETYVQPYQLGQAADTQDGIAKPIYYIDNTGNVDEGFGIYWNNTLPTGVTVCGNSSCSGTCADSGDVAACTTIGVEEGSITALATTIKTDEYLNITLYGNVTSSATAGETNRILYIKSSAV